jgi:hypothetical protein
MEYRSGYAMNRMHSYITVSFVGVLNNLWVAKLPSTIVFCRPHDEAGCPLKSGKPLLARVHRKCIWVVVAMELVF